jgi:hypothetical protein
MENADAKYIIFKVEPLEVINKAQVLVYAHLKHQELGAQSELENALLEIYEQHKNIGGFKDFERPTVVGVYLYASEKLGRQDRSSWIAMLMKGPRDDKPQIRIDKLRLNGLTALESGQWTEEELALERLNKELFERGLELCSFSKRLDEIELDCIQKADKRYPNYGLEHMRYNDELLSEAMKEVYAIHDLTYDLVNRVHVFARTYCR